MAFFLGCSNTPPKEAEVTRPDIIIDSSDISNYWVLTEYAIPKNPRQLAFERKSGCVNVEFVIGSDGYTYNHRVIKIYPESNKWLEYATIKAFKKRRYKPASENAGRISVVTNDISTFYVVKSSAPEGLSEEINEALKLECKK